MESNKKEDCDGEKKERQNGMERKKKLECNGEKDVRIDQTGKKKWIVMKRKRGTKCYRERRTDRM